MIGEFFRVLRAGVELSNAETWKRRQVLVNALAALLGALAALAAAFGHPLAIDQEGVNALAGAVATVVGLFNGWATVATTTRIGLSARPDDAPPGRDDGSGDPGNAGEDRAGADGARPVSILEMDQR